MHIDLAQSANTTIWENNAMALIMGALIIVLVVVLRKFLGKLISRLLYRVIKKTTTDHSIEEFVKLVRQPLEQILVLLVLYAGSRFVIIPVSWHLVDSKHFGVLMVLHRAYGIGFILSLVLLSLRLIDYFSIVNNRRLVETQSRMGLQLIPFLRELGKILVVVFAVFVILGGVFKVNVATLVAGLGIGGLAVALAAKETVENLFASFTLFLDKPFVVGDTIKVGAVTGEVEAVGFRSTRIRTVDKSWLTIPNKDLIGQALDNLSRKPVLKATYILNLYLGTTADVVEGLVNGVREVLAGNDLVQPNFQVFLVGVGDNTLQVNVLFYVNTAENLVFLEVRQAVTLEILKVVKGSGTDLKALNSA